MTVDIRRRADVAVSQPLLNLLHGNIVGQQQRSAGVAKIVEADMPQSLRFQQLTEVGTEISGIEDVAHHIHKHIAVIIVVVAVATDALVLLLLRFRLQKLFAQIGNERQGAEARLCFRSILFHSDIFAIDPCGGYNVPIVKPELSPMTESIPQ